LAGGRTPASPPGGTCTLWAGSPWGHTAPVAAQRGLFLRRGACSSCECPVPFFFSVSGFFPTGSATVGLFGLGPAAASHCPFFSPPADPGRLISFFIPCRRPETPGPFLHKRVPLVRPAPLSSPFSSLGDRADVPRSCPGTCSGPHSCFFSPSPPTTSSVPRRQAPFPLPTGRPFLLTPPRILGWPLFFLSPFQTPPLIHARTAFLAWGLHALFFPPPLAKTSSGPLLAGLSFLSTFPPSQSSRRDGLSFFLGLGNSP